MVEAVCGGKKCNVYTLSYMYIHTHTYIYIHVSNNKPNVKNGLNILKDLLFSLIQAYVLVFSIRYITLSTTRC